jgi:hypothetical protein
MSQDESPCPLPGCPVACRDYETESLAYTERLQRLPRKGSLRRRQRNPVRRRCGRRHRGLVGRSPDSLDRIAGEFHLGTVPARDRRSGWVLVAGHRLWQQRPRMDGVHRERSLDGAGTPDDDIRSTVTVCSPQVRGDRASPDLASVTPFARRMFLTVVSRSHVLRHLRCSTA